ncbi:MAG: hypothetical protein ACR2NN_25605 [Bryobacteraceae bacterium]
MDSPGLTDTRVALLHGEALVEVTELFKENSLRVMDHGATTTLLKKGLYEFDVGNPKVAVLDGKATVSEADQQVELKKGKEAFLNSPLKSEKFDRKAHDDLYNWSNVRSEYLAEAAAQSASTYVVNGGGWYGPGWYWNNWYGMYSFLPGDGILYSPFGWGFYSPAYVYSAPRYIYGGGGRRVFNASARSYRATAPSMTMHSPSMGMRAPSVSMSRGLSGGGRRR